MHQSLPPFRANFRLVYSITCCIYLLLPSHELFGIGFSAVCGVPRRRKVYHEHLRDVVAWVIESSAQLAEAQPPGEDHHSHDHHQVMLNDCYYVRGIP